MTVMVLDLNQHIIDVAIAAPEEVESVTIIGDDIESQTHTQGVKLGLTQEMRLKAFFPDFSKGYWRDVL